ncbi:tetratricopeptide repeat protein [Desulfurivibrio dismutans]|uniref:tetratricopeptide repeat protein n=1 Tax=Desulfurivibrio dismutans TaxID=1398908 RepID=UPI0023DBC01D|nr:tetratricopeptide repeat protein [Desulfurivibrio alkaliphilus]MDF1615161.1 tetratricopeptide repeat protein [Desulfurivibrio alkaliphilus]
MSNDIDKEQEEPKSQAQQDYDEGLEKMKNKALPQAAAAFHNSLRGFEEEGDETGVARAVTKLAEVCLLREEYPKALEHLQRALAICRAANDHLSVTYLEKQLFYTNLSLGNHERALELGLELLAAYQDYNNPAGAVEILEKLAEVYLAVGDRAKAAESLRTAAGIHKNFKHQRAAQQLLDQAEAISRG